MQNRIANGAPSNRQIRNLQNGRVQLNNFVQRNNAAVLGRAIAGTDELPTVIAITLGGRGSRTAETATATQPARTRKIYHKSGLKDLSCPRKNPLGSLKESLQRARLSYFSLSMRESKLFLCFYKRESVFGVFVLSAFLFKWRVG